MSLVSTPPVSIFKAATLTTHSSKLSTARARTQQRYRTGSVQRSSLTKKKSVLPRLTARRRHRRLNGMVTTRAIKRAEVGSKNPLQHEGLRDHVSSLVGAGHWWFVAQVSKDWKTSCQNVKQNSMEDELDHYKRVTCAANTTLTKAAFASAACCSLATDPNVKGRPPLENSGWRLQRIAGQFSDLETLRLAHERGLPATDSAIQGAAESGSLEKVQWLHEL
jgi:hypothetical protein